MQTQLNGSTFNGTTSKSVGGVGRNMADALAKLGHQILFISCTGSDHLADEVFKENPQIVCHTKYFITFCSPSLSLRISLSLSLSVFLFLYIYFSSSHSLSIYFDSISNLFPHLELIQIFHSTQFSTSVIYRFHFLLCLGLFRNSTSEWR